MSAPLILALAVSVLALLAGELLRRHVMAQDAGPPEMQPIAGAIREGAEAFLARQYRTVAVLALAVAAALFLLYAFLRSTGPAEPAAPLAVALYTCAAFVLGAACSAASGYVGMWISIRANLRTAAAARTSLGSALRVALRGGAVSGIFVAALSLLGIGGLFAALDALGVPERHIPLLMVGYGFGASFVALFAQLGGGIYTKAADVGADLVGKVEAGIPEDDPRNPAVIADLVGDNVGDCAGRGADLFESTAAENIGAMILAVALYRELGVRALFFPLVVHAFGLIASIAGVLVVRAAEDEEPMHALNRGFYAAAGLAVVGFFGASAWLLRTPKHPNGWIRFFACGVIGVAVAVVFVYVTQYYTEYRFRPVRSIADASLTGPATNLIAGVAVGFECTALPALAIGAAVIASYELGQSAFPEGGLFGTAVATMGMLGPAAYVLAMDTFGPITDNAGGIVEMSRQPDEVRRRTDRLDAVGNTTKALTKGYAIGSAALAAFLLFSAYLDEVRQLAPGLAMFRSATATVNLADPLVWVGGLLGAMLVFLFSGLAIRAVGNAAAYVIEEVRTQFRERPGILTGAERPDYGRCVDIVTRAALRQMVLPGLLAVAMPVAVGLVFRLFDLGAEGVAALLMVGTIAGVLVALFLNNSGGAWDNAKKLIETGRHGGKRSEPHRAAVIGDTVGDPFKDTAGPSLHVLVKLLATVTLVLAPFFVNR